MFIGTIFSSFPEFQKVKFDENTGNYSFKSSQGIKIDLKINEVAKTSFFIPQKISYFNLSNAKTKINVESYSKLILINDDINKREFTLADNGLVNIKFGERYEIQIGNVDKTLSFLSPLKTLNLKIKNNVLKSSNINLYEYLYNGENNLSFILNYPSPNFLQDEVFNETIIFDKFSNEITLSDFSNITSKNKVIINGKIKDKNEKVYYAFNVNLGNLPINLGLLNKAEVNETNGKFSFDSSNILIEGKNSLRIFTIKDGVKYTADEEYEIIVDTINPKLEIIEKNIVGGLGIGFYEAGNKTYVNSGDVNYFFKREDIVFLNYSVNSESFQEVEIDYNSNNISINFGLKEKDNVLNITARDRAGNSIMKTFNLFYDQGEVSFDEDKLSPFENGGEVFSQFVKVEGAVSKPFTKIEIYTFLDGESECDGISKYEKNKLLRNLGNLNGENDDEENPEEYQFSSSDLLGKRTLIADENGNFGSDSITDFSSLISFKHRNFENNDLLDDDKEPPKLGLTASKNIVCFIMTDKFGGVTNKEISVNFLPGNSQFSVEDIQITPQTMYASEIANRGVNNEGRASFSVFLKLNAPTEITNLKKTINYIIGFLFQS